jgi:ABC-type nitrate/sulfonate/bicarbonate transport system permease component
LEDLTVMPDTGMAPPLASEPTGIVPSAGRGGVGSAAAREPGHRGRTLALRVAAGVGLLAVWQLVVTLWAPSYIATPLGTVERIATVLIDSEFLGDVGGTLSATVEGLLIAVVVGTALGLVMGRLPDVNRVLGMYVGAFYAIPLVAIVPLVTVWFGYTPTARLVMVVIEGVLPIIYNVAEGARVVSGGYLDVTRIHHAPWWRVWGGVVLPNAVPYALAGVDLAIGRALVGAVVAEFVTAVPGVGYYILFNVRSFHQNEAMVALLVLVVFALAVRALVNLAVARGLPWYRPVKES